MGCGLFQTQRIECRYSIILIWTGDRIYGYGSRSGCLHAIVSWARSRRLAETIKLLVIHDLTIHVDPIEFSKRSFHRVPISHSLLLDRLISASDRSGVFLLDLFQRFHARMTGVDRGTSWIRKRGRSGYWSGWSICYFSCGLRKTFKGVPSASHSLR